MSEWVARECMKGLAARGCKKATVTILGMTFKENVPDIRNSKVCDVARALEKAGVLVQVHDPFAAAEETHREYGISLTAFDALRPADAVILAVAHQDYINGGWPLVTRLLKDGTGSVLDIKSQLDRAHPQAEPRSRRPPRCRGSGFPRSRRLIGCGVRHRSVAHSRRRECLFGLFWPLTFAQSHTRSAAVLVDELDACFFKGSPDFVSGCLPTAEPASL
jgi:UDP-glucose/GDP-mannose dehydrogenase family, UDP binding domain